VAIVDTGIDFTHRDLQGSLGSASFSAHGSSAQDDHDHGTHVAGIVGARNNTLDVVGVAPACTLYAVKVLDQRGSGWDSDIEAGLDWIGANAALVNPPIRVVNMSLGRPGSADDNPSLRQSVQALVAAGITVVVSAGNDCQVEVSEHVPASYPEVMAIASTTALTGSSLLRGVSPIVADSASYFTTDGVDVATSAPGADKENISRAGFVSSVGILSLKRSGTTVRFSGTSMSSPHVAGVVALQYQKFPDLTPDQARAKVSGSADRIGAAPIDGRTTCYTSDGIKEGILNAPGALQ
jgi:subtilisin/minor extracellular protease Epr